MIVMVGVRFGVTDGVVFGVIVGFGDGVAATAANDVTGVVDPSGGGDVGCCVCGSEGIVVGVGAGGADAGGCVGRDDVATRELRMARRAECAH